MQETPFLLPSTPPGQALTPHLICHVALDSALWFLLVPSREVGSLVLRHSWLEGGGRASVSQGSLTWPGLEAQWGYSMSVSDVEFFSRESGAGSGALHRCPYKI